MDYQQFFWLNERTFYWRFDQLAPEPRLAHLMACQARLQGDFASLLCDCVIGYDTLTVTLNRVANGGEIALRMAELLTAMTAADTLSAKAVAQIEIPVWYHASVAPDLALVAEHAGLSVDEVIALHTGQSYRVCALGFAPGFAYLGYLNPRIATPRKDSPRAEVAAGSVAIADNQTGIYPRNSPGGWQIIGRTWLSCFDSERPPADASLFRLGAEVAFVSVSEACFRAGMAAAKAAWLR